MQCLWLTVAQVRGGCIRYGVPLVHRTSLLNNHHRGSCQRADQDVALVVKHPPGPAVTESWIAQS